MLTDVYHPASGVGDSAALAALVQEITQDNPSVESGQQREININGNTAQTIECRNALGSNGGSEHYWITAFPQTDGSLRYLAFVSPTEKFKLLRPTFHRILRSVTVQN
jgi:hypothetical protein